MNSFEMVDYPLCAQHKVLSCIDPASDVVIVKKVFTLFFFLLSMIEGLIGNFLIIISNNKYSVSILPCSLVLGLIGHLFFVSIVVRVVGAIA